MNFKVIIIACAVALGAGLISCSSQQGDQAGKPGIMQRNDSMNQKPALGDTNVTPNPTGN